MHCKICRPEVGRKVSSVLTGKVGSRLGATVSDETKKKLRVANLGKKLSAKTKQRISEASKQHWKNPKLRRRMIKAMHGRQKAVRTSLEFALRRMLYEAGFMFEEQKSFQMFVVDVYVPSHNLVFEADGTYWHEVNERRNPGYHERRDKFLLTQVSAVIRLTEHDLHPWL